MPVPVIIGASLATLALVLYCVGVLMTVVSGKVRKSNVIMQTIAVASDAIATVCMMIQAGDIVPADLHGYIGYTALALMIADLVLVYRHKQDGKAPAAMRVYAALALVFWIVSYSQGFVKM